MLSFRALEIVVLKQGAMGLNRPVTLNLMHLKSHPLFFKKKIESLQNRNKHLFVKKKFYISAYFSVTLTIVEIIKKM
jgi:hypothetical protein